MAEDDDEGGGLWQRARVEFRETTDGVAGVHAYICLAISW